MRGISFLGGRMMPFEQFFRDVLPTLSPETRLRIVEACAKPEANCRQLVKRMEADLARLERDEAEDPTPGIKAMLEEFRSTLEEARKELDGLLEFKKRLMSS